MSEFSLHQFLPKEGNHIRLNYESLLNPEHSLPSVTLEPVAPKTEVRGTFISFKFLIRDEFGTQIGEVILNVSRPIQGKAYAYLNHISIKKEYRKQRKGYGHAAYLEVLKLLDGRLPLRSGFQLSYRAKKIWSWLIEKGVATQTDVGSDDDSKKDAGYSSAEYTTLG